MPCQPFVTHRGRTSSAHRAAATARLLTHQWHLAAWPCRNATNHQIDSYVHTCGIYGASYALCIALESALRTAARSCRACATAPRRSSTSSSPTARSLSSWRCVLRVHMSGYSGVLAVCDTCTALVVDQLSCRQTRPLIDQIMANWISRRVSCRPDTGIILAEASTRVCVRGCMCACEQLSVARANWFHARVPDASRPACVEMQHRGVSH